MMLDDRAEPMRTCEHTTCAAKRIKWLRGTRNLEAHRGELKKLIAMGTILEWSRHLDEREMQRQIPSRQSTDAFENGECIWFGVVNDPIHGLTNKWLWLGYAKIGKATYRPLHLVITCNAKESTRALTVATVYDPSEKPWIWNDTFETKICWEQNLL